ncbi:MAG: glycosyltransferase family 2 protein [Candidatus Saganbacteria bacterium]|nr:glycosyltransferase family 2 protein [Candidatus Saganbacteria bacterium]
MAAATGPRVLVIIPAYNEAASIAGVVAKVCRTPVQADLLVVNDGSLDATAGLARQAGAVVLDLPFNLGIGVARQTGYQYAESKNYDIAVQMDADGQHDPDDIMTLVEALLKDRQADIVIGSRFFDRQGYRSTIFRKLGIGILKALLKLFFGLKVGDPTSGFQAVDRQAIELFSRIYPTDFPEVEALALARRHGLKITEVPVSMLRRQGGSSSITPLKAAYYMIKVPLSLFIAFIKGEPQGGDNG